MQRHIRNLAFLLLGRCKAFLKVCLTRIEFCEDFAEGEIKSGYYAIRFKDHDTAMSFKKAFDEARKVNAE